MSNAPAILRTFITYMVCVPLAVFLGYLLANPTNPRDYTNMAIYGILALLLCFPLLLRWHNWLLLLFWNLSMNLFFLPGSPPPWLLMGALSLGLSVLQRTLIRRSQFVSVPEITWPLIFMTVVVMGTAKLTGGFGLRVLGSPEYGGRKYICTFGAILGYFALSALRIPPHRRKLALGLFFLGGVTGIIGELYLVLPSGFNFLFWFFSPDTYATSGGMFGEHQMIRFSATMGFSQAITQYMLAWYGIRGIFLARKPWRWIVFVLVSLAGLLGGFRNFAVLLVLVFSIQFFLEGMHRTKLLPIFGMLGISAMLLILPQASRLPLTFQRSLAFLPVKLDPVAEADAKDSWEWRYEMWKEIFPLIPRHLLLGKGYGFSAEDYQFMGRDTAFHPISALQGGLGLSMDYHNGWISILMTFGIWGMIAFLWFAAAGIYVLCCNYRYGDASLRTANALLLATFIVRVLFVMTVSGLGLHADLYFFTGLLGLGVSLNGGVCRQPAFQLSAAQKPSALTSPFPQSRPVFQR